jgi:beta-glucosidase
MDRTAQLIEEMTLPEKVGQMAQVSVGAVTPAEIADHAVGSVLSGGGGNPTPNTPAAWADMVDSLVEASRGSRPGIELIYGTDAVHGHSNVRGATMFPHSIGLGAAGSAELVASIAEATAIEMWATGARWNFAPVLAVANDLRWGRTYESFGRDPDLVGRLGASYVTGLQGLDPESGLARVLACPKHFVGDGATRWGTAPRIDWVEWWDGWGDDWSIDQGDADVDEDELRTVHLAPYGPALDCGAGTVMASYSSWRGAKLHGHRPLLTDVLKGELGFDGFVVSDWMGIDQLDPDYRTCVVRAVNAGVDMVMIPFDLERFATATIGAVTDGEIGMARIDDAVRRILRAKATLGLFDEPEVERPSLAVVGCDEHRALAREAVRRSAVLLANDGGLPIAPGASLLVAGDAADDMGLQCGGWTIEWQGGRGSITPGTTLLEALRSAHAGPVLHDAAGRFPDGQRGEVGVVVIAEEPYAEGLGDRPDLALAQDYSELVRRMRSHCDRVVLVVYSGRPVAIADLIAAADAVVAAWLPGTEAAGLADVLLGSHPFAGRLPQPWPQDAAAASVQFPVGHGLRAVPGRPNAAAGPGGDR